MTTNDVPPGDLLDVMSLVDAIPYCIGLIDRDGLPCPVWRNPISVEYQDALRTGSRGIAGLRALLTASDLYVWQSVKLLHGGFVQQTGIDGVRVRLDGNVVFLNEETVAFPAYFSWIFSDAGVAQALDYRCPREIAAQWLRQSSKLRHLHPSGFLLRWYS